jgi:uncharacterized membrane protein
MKRRLVAVARVFLVVAGLSPFAPALLARGGFATSFAGALEVWFRFQCERDPERMLAAGAVCARCLGLYVGLGAGALVVRPRLGGCRLELWLAVAALAMLADVASEWLGWRAAWAPLRFATGLLLGYPAGVAVVAGLDAWARGVVASAPVAAPDA